MSGTTTPTVDLPRSKVRVTTPNPQTREIIERVIPAKSLRPRPPKEPQEPQLDDRLITVIRRGGDEGPTGRSVIAMIDHRERLLEHRAQLEVYWQHFSNHLRRDEQLRLARLETASILRPFEPCWQPGDRMYVASHMEAEVIEVTEGPRGFGTVFLIHNHRETFLRRGVLGDDVPKTDEDGYARGLTPHEKERARLDGAYTTSRESAVDEGGLVLDPESARRLHPEQSAHNALSQGKGRVVVTKGRLQRRLAEARAKNRTSTVRYLERQLTRLEAKGAA